MRPNKPKTTGEGDLFRARLDQIINMKHELVQLAARIDWDWIDREVAPLYSENGRPGIDSLRDRAVSPKPTRPGTQPPSTGTRARAMEKNGDQGRHRGARRRAHHRGCGGAYRRVCARRCGSMIAHE